MISNTGLMFVFKWDGIACRRPAQTQKFVLLIIFKTTLWESILFNSNKRSFTLIMPDSKKFVILKSF